MRISNKILGFGVIFASGLGGVSSRADDVMMDGGARLTGTVRSIDEAGGLELASDLSPGPVMLSRDVVRRVSFSAKSAAAKAPGALVELANGDLLPATIESFDDRILTITSPQAGRLEIPRAALKSLEIGVRQRSVVYAGPRNLEEWSGDEGEARNWVFEHGSLIANGLASASRNFALPQQFILRFTLKWQARQIPNFQIYFADPLKEKGVPCDRYYMNFNNAGFEVKREAVKGKHFTSLHSINRNPGQCPNQELRVELRVDRKASRFHLVLNDEPEGDFVDLSPPLPDGTGITLVSNAQNGSPQEISNIEILEFDGTHLRHHAEDRGDPKTDSLISREDDRWSGHLAEIRHDDAGPLFRFKSESAAEPLEIQATDVSTVFFAAQDDKKDKDDPKDKTPDAAQAHPLVLRLSGEGALRVASCVFTEDKVSAVHPLLGPLSLRRDGIVAMERADSTAKTAPRP